MRKFKLLKDLPTIKAGAIGIKEGSWYKFETDSINANQGVERFSERVVEASKEWFEEIKEEPKKEGPKKTVRRWLWDCSRDGQEWFIFSVWMDEAEADTELNRQRSIISDRCKLQKTKFNGQEIWRDFEE